MKTHIIRRREGETLSDYVMRWLVVDRERRELEEVCATAKKPPQKEKHGL